MDFLLPGAPVIFLLAWFGWRIACKAGYSGFWGLTALVPPVGLLALWYLAAAREWPEQGGSEPRNVAENRDTGSIAIRRPSALTPRKR